jgi:hypothetical protein
LTDTKHIINAVNVGRGSGVLDEYPKIEPKNKLPADAPHTPAPEVERQVATDPVEYLPSEMKESYLIELIEGLKFAKDHFEMPSLIKEINDFILSETKDNKESYKKVVDEYIKKLHLPYKMDIYTKIEKLAEIMRIDKKLIEMAKTRDELLKKPIEELTSKQLMERINAKLN